MQEIGSSPWSPHQLMAESKWRHQWRYQSATESSLDTRLWRYVHDRANTAGWDVTSFRWTALCIRTGGDVQRSGRWRLTGMIEFGNFHSEYTALNAFWPRIHTPDCCLTKKSRIAEHIFQPHAFFNDLQDGKHLSRGKVEVCVIHCFDWGFDLLSCIYVIKVDTLNFIGWPSSCHLRKLFGKAE